MADDLSLLFRLRAQNQASPVIKGLQSDINKLKQSTTSDFTQINQIATSSLSRITSSITSIASQVPVLGTAVNGLSSDMTALAAGTGEAASGLAAMAGPLGIAAAGFIATAVAAEQLGAALFESAKSAADYQGKLLDLSQQTGVSVETLSALEIAASTTGGTIESVSASLGIFQKNMAEASDANSKAAKSFAALGVTVTDTEDTLRQTLTALAAMPEGFRQTNAALELFGRGGKQVLAIVKETNGNIDELIEKLRGAGLVTTEQAKRADEMNDQLALLSFQLRGLGTQIIPQVTDAVKQLSTFLRDNKEGAQALQLGLSALAAFFVGPFKGALLVAQVNIKAVTDALEFLRLKAKEPIVIGVELKGADSSGLALLKELKAAGLPLGPSKPSDDLLRSSGLLKSTGAAPRIDAETEAQKKLKDAINATNKATADLNREFERAEEERARDSERRRVASLSFIDQQTEQINRLKGITVSAFDDARRALALFDDVLSDADKNLISANARTIQLLRDAASLKESLENIALTPGVGGTAGTELPLISALLGEDAPEAIQRFTGFKEALDLVGDSVNDLAFGIGDLVQQWVLLGDTGPDAMRKLTASVLAGLAAQAAVKAVFQLAEGFAALFFNPAEAAAHFQSAALFGSIAGVAAVAGRSVAGDLFRPSPGANGRSTVGASGALQTITQGRNQPQPLQVMVVVQPDGSKFGEAVTAHVVQNIGNGGEIREVIANDGRAA